MGTEIRSKGTNIARLTMASDNMCGFLFIGYEQCGQFADQPTGNSNFAF